jgi:predicted HicB family RNase H-like nuclease
MNTMTHMGQTAQIEFDARDNIFVGRLLGIADSVSFHADTLVEIHKAFVEAVDDYIETCAKIIKAVENPA